MQTERPDIILQTLSAAGFAAYYVGGCVRDTLLGRPIHDWDVATSAKPEDVMKLFAHTVPTGLRHGTVTVISGSAQAEVTTFRQDGTYRDSRRPDSVRFVSSLAEDLIRRDFTVNAMAMNAQGQITDLCGGRQDLEKKIIRCVGDPDRRFSEDALRMLRALRFSAQLGFSVEEKTMQAICKNAPLCETLSCERVRDESEKTLFSPKPQVLQTMISLGLLKAVGIETCADLGALAALPATGARWAMLKRLAPQFQPKKMRLPAKLCEQIEAAAGCVLTEQTELDLKRLLAKYGEQTAKTAAEVNGKQALLTKILESGDCVRLSDLAVSGSDLAWLHGEAVGRMLERLLEHVFRHPEDNQKQILLDLAKKG